jgi:hypothetical protein
MKGEPMMDDLFAGIATIQVYSDSGRTSLLDEWSADDEGVAIGPTEYTGGDTVYIYIETDSGLESDVHQLTVGEDGPFLGKWTITLVDFSESVRGVVYISWIVI